MSSQEPNHDETNPLPDSLDAIVRRALAVDPAPERVARLQSFWHQRRKHALRWRRAAVWGGLAAAASIAIVVVGYVRHDPPSDAPQQARHEENAHTPDSAPPPDHQVATGPVEIQAPSSSTGRPPTAYERLVFVARTGGIASAGPNLPQVVDELIGQVVAQPDTDLVTLVTETGVEHTRIESLLLRRLPRATPEDSHAIVRLLGQCGSTRAIPALARWARRTSQYDHAAMAMNDIVGDEGLPGVFVSTDDQALRQALGQRLLASESDVALRQFLSLVANDASRRDALAVMLNVSAPRIEELFALLDDDEKTVRLGAALALGKLNGTEITRALIERVTARPAGSTEAWIALLACRGELANDFFAYATQRPQLLGYINGARLQWAQLVH